MQRRRLSEAQAVSPVVRETAKDMKGHGGGALCPSTTDRTPGLKVSCGEGVRIPMLREQGFRGTPHAGTPPSPKDLPSWSCWALESQAPGPVRIQLTSPALMKPHFTLLPGP